MTHFKKVKFKNFLSTGDQWIEIDLNSSGTTLILGENGAGKSQILDAISYGLFGKAYRNINIPQLVNSLNEIDMLVEVELQVGPKEYLIRRGCKPNIFEIYDNGDLIKQDSRKKDYQTEFETNILHLNYKSFCQVVVLGISTFTPFMQLPAAERRFIIEDLLGIQIFSAMNKLLKTRSDTLRDDINSTDIKFTNTEEKIELTEGYMAQVQADNNRLIKDAKKSIEVKLAEKLEIVRQVDRINLTVEELNQKSASYDTLQDKIKNLENLESKLGTKINKYREDIEFFSTNNECPTCKQAIDSEFKTKTIQSKTKSVGEMEAALEELNTQLKGNTLKLDGVKHVLSAIHQHQIDVSVLNNKIGFIENSIEDLQEKIIDFEKNSQSKFDGQKSLVKLQDDMKVLEEKRNELQELRHYYELVSLMLKDLGIKTQIIRQYLPLINKYVNKYLSDMGFFVNFHLDESFKEVIKSRGRDEFSYESFSEGEKLRIDLSLLFTWREIAKLKNTANANILILDEIFDSSLDASGIEEFMKLIQTVGKGVNIFVVSHKGDSLIDKFDRTIKFKKTNNFSVIVED